MAAHFEIEATTIAPTMDSEAAIIADLPPGAYTAIATMARAAWH